MTKMDDLGLSDEMMAALSDDSVAIAYEPTRRHFSPLRIEKGLPPVDLYEKIKQFGSTGDSCILEYCPWTGGRLVEYLGDEWMETAFQLAEDTKFDWGEYRRDPDSILNWLPSCMHSDAWWRNMGLPITYPKPPDPTQTERLTSEGLKIVLDSRYHTPTVQSPDIPPAVIYEDFSQHEPLGPPAEEIEYPQDPEAPGLSRWNAEPPHRCADTDMVWWSYKTMYAYLPHTREFGIRILDIHRPVDHQPIRIKPVRYCPWCGERLPPGLRGEWARRVSALGLAVPLDLNPITPPPDLPADLASDAWWRNAGL
ncbi:DUF6980 family protein [Roseospirillum parvum]|uniref:DUF6980 domain-containing protein n=1 Tax=Roseospirillum parvum TaxID=83401 RepID=A0A1G8E9H9_9PROT|nr:hypothetical protein [Roseospirillum parvum]SDH66575.1 hypothetical protein SAMN05421742_10979 [Roseospirillum parvum]